MGLLAYIGGLAVAIAIAAAIRDFVQSRRTPEVLGTSMSPEWQRHVQQLLSKPGAGEGTYIEG